MNGEIVYYETPEEVLARETANAEATERSRRLEDVANIETQQSADALGIPFGIMRELEELRKFKQYQEDRPLRPIPDLLPYIPGCCR